MHNASTLCMKCTVCVVTSLILNVECGLENQKKLIAEITYLSLNKAALSCYFYVIFFMCYVVIIFNYFGKKSFPIKRKYGVNNCLSLNRG